MLQSNLVQQRVFVVGDGSLLDDGVTHMLTHRTDLLVSRAIYSDDFAFLNSIKSERPDVILVCESGSLDTARILDLVLAQVMAMAMAVRIVVVRLRDNMIDVYARPAFVAGRMLSKPRQIIAKTGDDLLKVFFD